MAAKVHCPRCSEFLHVPESACGKPARCPLCQQVFRIPEASELFEETVSTWIEEDVDQWMDHLDHEIEDKILTLRPTRVGQRLDPPSLRDGGKLKRSRKSSSSKKPAPESNPKPARNNEAPDKPGKVDPVARQTSAPAPEDEVADGAADDITTAASSVDGDVERLLSKLSPSVHREGATPYLAVLECHATGVRLAFDARWLEHEGFRLSMPMRCVFSDVRDRGVLLARPLAFVDRSSGQIRSAKDLESQHEHHLREASYREAILSAMGTLPMPRPFDHPMPYYVAEDQTHLSLACSTKQLQDGTWRCEVLMPNGELALRWLARVNGTCGPEYRLLGRAVALLQNERWRALPQKCRQRVASWAKFEPGEQFQGYWSDADFGTRDAGLAGLVVTDRRLIYKKYHHGGEARYRSSPRIQVKDEGEFSTVFVVSEGHRSRMCRLHTRDLSPLREVFSAVTDMPFDTMSESSP